MGNTNLSRRAASTCELRLVVDRTQQNLEFMARLEACAEDLRREAAIEADPKRREKLLLVAKKLVEFSGDR